MYIACYRKQFSNRTQKRKNFDKEFDKELDLRNEDKYSSVDKTLEVAGSKPCAAEVPLDSLFYIILSHAVPQRGLQAVNPLTPRKLVFRYSYIAVH